MSTTLPEDDKFSIFKPFTAFDHMDYLFRAKPAGTRMTASYMRPSKTPGVTEHVTGTYEFIERKYTLIHGYDVVGDFWADGAQNIHDPEYFADEVAFAILNPVSFGNTDIWMSVQFAHIAKKGA